MYEKRHALPASGPSIKRRLTDDQRTTLAEIEGFGWELQFVRQPSYADPVAVVYDHRHGYFAVLEADGRLNENPAITIRY
ncbi:MAG: hypothetical protein JSR34_09265 [Proteobacteria bacterium]|nr:hypothetical protein [Pseudomonadota bacterium]